MTTTKMTMREALKTLEGLMQLDGQEVIAKDGQREIVVKQPYKFKPGFRLAIAQNIAKLRAHANDYADASKALLLQVTNGSAKYAKGSAEDIQYELGLDDLLGKKIDVDLAVCKFDNLNLTENAIPSSVISLLLPVLEE